MTSTPDPTPVTLPHTGLRVPHTRLRVSSLHQIQLHCGVAYTGTLRRDRTAVGVIENEGTGGPTMFIPTDRTTFGDSDLDAFAAACRTASGAVPTVEEVCEELVTEYDTARSVRRAHAKGRTLLRQYAYIHDDNEQPFGEPLISAEATATPPTTDPAREALIAQLAASMPAGPGFWWRIWTGQRWDDLTPRPVTSNPDQPTTI